MLLQLRLQPGDGTQRLRPGVVQVKNDQGRLLIAILADALENVFVGFDKFDLHIKLARGLRDLGQKKQVLNKREDARRCRFQGGRKRFRFGLKVLGTESTARSTPARAIAVALQVGTVAVIHGRVVNAAMAVVRSTRLLVLAAFGRVGITAAMTATASPASTGGGMGRSDHHTSLTNTKGFASFALRSCRPERTGHVSRAFTSAAVLSTWAAALFAQNDLKIHCGWNSVKSSCPSVTEPPHVSVRLMEDAFDTTWANDLSQVQIQQQHRLSAAG